MSTIRHGVPIDTYVDFSARAVLDVFPYDISLRSELRSPNLSEKI